MNDTISKICNLPIFKAKSDYKALVSMGVCYSSSRQIVNTGFTGDVLKNRIIAFLENAIVEQEKAAQDMREIIDELRNGF
ncbi:hypothetical protein [Acetobacter persici]|uniref:hypothetical protein n=1 Tax=Acetobacter persici TaxID=1076596 RepID=UPI001BA8B016|nr:hypothetical protein [Acetobacter persici]MBS1017246.1 hypothetical protein [Acetobacter persici]